MRPRRLRQARRGGGADADARAGSGAGGLESVRTQCSGKVAPSL